MKVFFHTLGCKVNHYETQEMRELFEKSGYEITCDETKADIIVINSCTVTAESDRKSRQCVRHFKKINPSAITVLTGCMPQAYEFKAEQLSEADIILGNKTNYRIIEATEQFLSTGKPVSFLEEHKSGEPMQSPGICRFEERTRAFLKIEDGCDRFCSYCAIPYARGRVRSKPVKEVIKEAVRLAENGFVEIVLVGINLSAYGKDLEDGDFPSVIKAVCDIQKVKRVRLGSLEPDHLTNEVIEKLSKTEKLCPQFHISLQSGCDNTLKRMNRHYTAEEYASLCSKLRSSFRDCTLTTDIMVGFPGESEEDFNETVDFVRKIRFEKIHVFPYSVREGTRAEKFENRIDNKTKAKRASVLSDVASKIREEFLKEQIGKSYEVLIEQTLPDGKLFGYTANYIPVKISPEAKEKDGKYLIIDSDKEYCYA